MVCHSTRLTAATQGHGAEAKREQHSAWGQTAFPQPCEVVLGGSAHYDALGLCAGLPGVSHGAPGNTASGMARGPRFVKTC